MTIRVRPDVNGSAWDPRTETYVELDHDRDWSDDDPIVAANPDVFEAAKAKPKPKVKE